MRVSGGSLLTPATSRRPGPFCHRPPTPPDRSRFIKAPPPPPPPASRSPSLLFHEFSTLPLAQSPSRPPSNNISPAEAHNNPNWYVPIPPPLLPARDPPPPRETRRPPTRRLRDPTASPFDLHELPEPGRRLSPHPSDPQIWAPVPKQQTHQRGGTRAMSKSWLLRWDTRPKLRESGLATCFCQPRTLVGGGEAEQPRPRPSGFSR